MVVTTEIPKGTGHVTINKVKAKIEAGELHVSKDDAIIPSKLRLLADLGWSIQDVWRVKDGGFNLLLTRNVIADEDNATEPIGL